MVNQKDAAKKQAETQARLLEYYNEASPEKKKIIK